MRALFVLFLLAICPACDSSSKDSTGQIIAKDVRYVVEGTGQTTILSISYVQGDGKQVSVAQPILPWTVPVAVKSGSKLSITAVAAITTGSLTVGIRDVTGGDVLLDSHSCRLSGSQAQNCSVTASATLP